MQLTNLGAFREAGWQDTMGGEEGGDEEEERRGRDDHTGARKRKSEGVVTCQNKVFWRRELYICPGPTIYLCFIA